MNLSIYFGAEGHVFGRLTPTVGGMSGSVERVVGAGKWVANFSGTSLTLFNPFLMGAARRMTVDFDSHFASCTAAAMYGKQSDDAVMVTSSPITGGNVEMLSNKPGPATCSVQQGNVFGN